MLCLSTPVSQVTKPLKLISSYKIQFIFQICTFAKYICSVQFSSVTQSCQTLCDPKTHQASLSITNSQSLPKLLSIESVMPSNHLILCHPLLLPSIFPNIRIFSNDSELRIRWPKYCRFRFSTSPSNDHSGLISFRMDWLDLQVVQGTLKCLLQHHSSKASFFGAQRSL